MSKFTRREILRHPIESLQLWLCEHNIKNLEDKAQYGPLSWQDQATLERMAYAYKVMTKNR